MTMIWSLSCGHSQLPLTDVSGMVPTDSLLRPCHSPVDRAASGPDLEVALLGSFYEKQLRRVGVADCQDDLVGMHVVKRLFGQGGFRAKWRTRLKALLPCTFGRTRGQSSLTNCQVFLSTMFHLTLLMSSNSIYSADTRNASYSE